ncbi:MAG TPA: hypothetical protein VK876_09795, partial [Rubrivivax sp.]|nr:hypothetical protein [Rubrivivax sp.]
GVSSRCERAARWPAELTPAWLDATTLADLALPGMQLPHCDSLGMLRRLRARPATALIPCAALSANATLGPVERALTAGPAAS